MDKEALKLEPPPECQTEAEKTAFAFGWFKAMEAQRLAQPEQELLAWKNAALRVGEDLSSVGPKGYYNMTAQQWLDWAMAQQPRGNNSLAQPEQEPVAWATREDFYRELDRSVNRMRRQMEIKGVVMRCANYDVALPVIDIREGHVLVGQVTTPPQRTWVGLTDEEMQDLWDRYAHMEMMRAIEAKLKEKNT